MTVDQLNKANYIQKEIEQISKVYLMLDLTIDKEEEAYNPIRRFIRFLNCRIESYEERKAHVFLFEDGMLSGQDIPAWTTLPKEYETRYKVIISDEVSMNDFTTRYKIIDQEGKIYTVREIAND